MKRPIGVTVGILLAYLGVKLSSDELVFGAAAVAAAAVLGGGAYVTGREFRVRPGGELYYRDGTAGTLGPDRTSEDVSGPDDPQRMFLEILTRDLEDLAMTGAFGKTPPKIDKQSVADAVLGLLTPVAPGACYLESVVEDFIAFVLECCDSGPAVSTHALLLGLAGALHRNAWPEADDLLDRAIEEARNSVVLRTVRLRWRKLAGEAPDPEDVRLIAESVTDGEAWFTS